MPSLFTVSGYKVYFWSNENGEHEKLWNTDWMGKMEKKSAFIVMK